MSTRRVRVVSLNREAGALPFPVTIDCHAWHLRMATRAEHRINGTVSSDYMSTAKEFPNGFIEIDVPPVFDDTGQPVPFNERLEFFVSPIEAMTGTLTLIYLDTTPPHPSR